MHPMPEQTEINDWPLWWFARLALKRGETTAASEALRNLERLEVEIRFTLPPPTIEGAK
jgi:hypothetical protein